LVCGSLLLAGGTPVGPEPPPAAGAGGLAPGRAPRPAPKPLTLDPPVSSAVTSRDGTLVAAGSRRPKGEKEKGDGGSPAASALMEREEVATLRVWETGSGKEVFTTGERTGPPLDQFAISPDNKTLAVSRTRPAEGSGSTAADQLEIWEIATGKLSRTVELG